MSDLPLTGVRVLDFTRVLAGPYCTMLLGDYGADVIKIEEPRLGDETREWGPPWVGGAADRMSAYYMCANRNKRSLALDLRTDEGRVIAQSLAAQAQVVVENFKPGGMAAFGLDYDSLHALNPRLVYCSITGFGQTGPYSAFPGYDFIIQAMSGLMSVTGPAEGEPYKTGVAITDVVAGLHATTAILAALRHSERTGQGQHLDVALLDCALSALVNVASSALIGDQVPERFGNAHPNIVPYQSFRASDRDFALAVGNDRQFARLCAIIGQPQLADDARFVTNPARVRHRDELIALLTASFRDYPASHWVSACQDAGIPCAPVNDIPTMLADPHTAARGLVQEVAMTHGEGAALVSMPVALSATPAQTRLPPPGHGSDTDALLRELLSYDDATLERLRSHGVIR